MSEPNETLPAPVPTPDAAITASETGAVNRTQAQTPDEIAAAAAMSASASVAIPGYEILSKLGRGGMGVVYRARDTRLNREVALKMILRADTSRVAVARFWAEAEVMAAVKHPHVVQVFELGEHDGQPFMAMELVSGGSLADRLRSSDSLPPHAAAELMERIARGVAAAHDLGIVHRDLKPGNILLADDKNPKVTDFGLAKRQANDLTATQAVMGTPAYMSPEQAAGRTKFVGPQADVWALGVILYECLAGRQPFDGDTAATLLSNIQSVEPAALRTLVRSVPWDLDTIAMKCLAKEPEHRYPTATELADDLGRFGRGEPIAARPVGRAERLVRWVRRKPTAAAAYGFSMLAVLLAAVVFVIFGFWRAAESAKIEAEGAKDTAERAKKDAEEARGRVEGVLEVESQLRGNLQNANAQLDTALTGERTARAGEAAAKREVAFLNYAHAVDLAYREALANNCVRARNLLDSCPEELRHWEWHYVHRLCYADLITLTGHANMVESASFSGDGKRIVTASDDKTARVWDAEMGKELARLKGHTDIVRSASFSGDGKRIVTASFDKTARVWDAETGKQLALLTGHASAVMSASFSGDGKRIVTASLDKTARVWDAETGKLMLTFSHAGQVTTACFRDDDTRITVVFRDAVEPNSLRVAVYDSRPVNRAFIRFPVAPMPRAR